LISRSDNTLTFSGTTADALFVDQPTTVRVWTQMTRAVLLSLKAVGLP
jgi:hypothetical protein